MNTLQSISAPINVRSRQCRAAIIVEAAAAMLIVIPLTITILFVVLELTTAYLIHTVLCQSAHQSARNLAITYPDDPTVAQSRVAQNVIAYDNFRVNGIIADSSQFEDAVFDTKSDPPTVTVTVHYTGGQYGLSRFPIGVLGLDPQFELYGKSSYRMEGN